MAARRNSLIYTGTHDNPITLSWFRSLDQKTKLKLEKYIGSYINEEKHMFLHDKISLYFSLRFAIIPMQDILSLDEDSGMNLPGRIDGNWEWKLLELLGEDVAFWLCEISKIYGQI